MNRVVMFVACLSFLNCITLLAHEVDDIQHPNIKLSISSPQTGYCTNKSIYLKVIFENLTDDDLLHIDPRTCESCLFFVMRNSVGEKLRPKVGKVIYQIIDTHVKLALFKPNAKIEFQKDITTQYFGENKYTFEKEGSYYVTALFFPQYRYITKSGKKAYTQKLESDQLKIQVSKCAN